VSVIHPNAIVDVSANIADDVAIGPFCYIGPNVEIGSGTVIESHVVIKGPTTIGRDNHIFQFASIGEQPQDLKYNGEPTRLEIGDRNTIREYVTLNRGTAGDEAVTKIGNDNLFMISSHVAHDCHIGNNVIMANSASLAGHVSVGDYAILGGFTTVHQFSRIGAHCFSGFASAVDRDILPYFTVAGNRAKAFGINKEGLKRRGFTAESIKALQKAFKILVKSKHSHKEAIEHLTVLAQDHAEVQNLLNFISESNRGWIR